MSQAFIIDDRKYNKANFNFTIALILQLRLVFQYLIKFIVLFVSDIANSDE